MRADGLTYTVNCPGIILLCPASPPSEPQKPSPPPVAKKPRKPEFSPTRLMTFLVLPDDVPLGVCRELGRFYHKARAGYTFGSTLHQTLQNFHEAGGSAEVSAEQLVKRLETDWQSQGYRTPSTSRNTKKPPSRSWTLPRGGDRAGGHDADVPDREDAEVGPGAVRADRAH